MIRQERLDELKRLDDPRQFFGAFSCEANSLVKHHRQVFEDRAKTFNERHQEFLTTVEKWLGERKKPLPPSVFEPYLKQLSGARKPKPSVLLSVLERCRKQLLTILEHGVNKSNHPVLSHETRILRQHQKQLHDIVNAAMATGKTFVPPPDWGIIDECLRAIGWQYKEYGWKEIRVCSKIQSRRRGREYRDFTFLVPPDFPEDPAWWLEVYRPGWYDLKARIARDMFTCSPEDELLRGYVALALLFNVQASERGETPIAPDILSEWGILRHTIEFLHLYWADTQNTSQQKPTDHWPKVRAVLIGDLEAVDRDLAATENRIGMKTMTLRQFMETRCEVVKSCDVRSKQTLLHEYNRRGKIRLPKTVKKYKKGQAKLYQEKDLEDLWPTYCEKCPSFPPLKAPTKRV